MDLPEGYIELRHAAHTPSPGWQTLLKTVTIITITNIVIIRRLHQANANNPPLPPAAPLAGVIVGRTFLAAGVMTGLP